MLTYPTFVLQKWCLWGLEDWVSVLEIYFLFIYSLRRQVPFHVLILYHILLLLWISVRARKIAVVWKLQSVVVQYILFSPCLKCKYRPLLRHCCPLLAPEVVSFLVFGKSEDERHDGYCAAYSKWTRRVVENLATNKGHGCIKLVEWRRT